MARFLSRRLLEFVPVLFAIVTLTFFLVRLAPGGPFDAEKAVSDEVLEHLIKLRAQAKRAFPPFELSFSLLLGYGWNRLELAELVPEEPKIFVPQAGNNGALFSVSLRGTYKLEF